MKNGLTDKRTHRRMRRTGLFNAFGAYLGSRGNCAKSKHLVSTTSAQFRTVSDFTVSDKRADDALCHAVTLTLYSDLDL